MPSPEQDQAAFETIPLLGEDRTYTNLNTRLSPETLLLPVALATRLATQLPLTTLIDLVRRVVCRIWNISHGYPAPHASSTPDLCDAPEIARNFSTAIMILGVMEGFIVIAACGILSRISSKNGRKPAFLIVLAAGVVGNCLLPWSQRMPSWLADWVLIIGLLLLLFSGSLPYAYLVNLYVIDVCDPRNRTAALSRVAGWAGLGTCTSLALGGFITTKTGNPLIVFYTAATISAAVLIYVASVLPESFPQEKREAQMPETSVDEPPAATEFASLHIFKPLKMLMPTRMSDGTRNWRLVWCSVHVFLYMAVNAYAATAWMVFVTSKYHFTPADTGLFLTIVAISSTIVLMVIVPPLVRFLRPYYTRSIRHPRLVEDDNIHDEVKLETSDRLDIHLAVMSCVAAALFYLSGAASRTKATLIASAICVGLTAIHTPTTRSLVAGSVDAVKQGEALAAIEMISNAGTVLSPIIMGNILTATIETTPLLVFYVHLVVVLLSSAFLFFIRDMRYQGSREDE